MYPDDLRLRDELQRLSGTSERAILGSRCATSQRFVTTYRASILRRSGRSDSRDRWRASVQGDCARRWRRVLEWCDSFKTCCRAARTPDIDPCSASAKLLLTTASPARDWRLASSPPSTRSWSTATSRPGAVPAGRLHRPPKAVASASHRCWATRSPTRRRSRAFSTACALSTRRHVLLDFQQRPSPWEPARTKSSH